MQYHLLASAATGVRLFDDHVEALALWRLILAEIPDPVALCLMPDHIHLQHGRKVSAALGGAMRRYARWRNNRHGKRGALWQRQPAPQPIADREKQRRTTRYIHLNPCRGRALVSDPLAWPFSTHRDRTGLAWPTVVAPARDRAAFHTYVSADPSVHVEGTSLPAQSPTTAPPLSPAAIRDAFAAVSRSSTAELQRRGPRRTQLIQCLRALTVLDSAEIGAFVGVDSSTVRRSGKAAPKVIELLRRVVHDPRFLAPERCDPLIQGYRQAPVDAWEQGADWLP